MENIILSFKFVIRQLFLIKLVKRLSANQIDRIKDLAKEGVSIRKIAEIFNVSKSTVYYHAKDYCRKMTRLNLDLLSEWERGYIIGLFLGDGDINKGRKNPRYVVRFTLDAKRDKDISLRLRQIFEKGYKKVSIFRRNNTLVAKVCSKELVKYIQRFVGYRREGTEQEKKLKIRKDWTVDFQYGVLAGIIDSDGHVHKHLGTEIKTVSPSIFKGIVNLLRRLGIKAKIKRRLEEKSYSKKIKYTVYIPSAEMKLYKNRICSVKFYRFHKL